MFYVVYGNIQQLILTILVYIVGQKGKYVHCNNVSAERKFFLLYEADFAHSGLPNFASNFHIFSLRMPSLYNYTLIFRYVFQCVEKYMLR